MKNSKGKIKMLIATVAVAAVCVAGTYAFLSAQTDELENTFTPSENIKVEIQEPNWDKDADNDGSYGSKDAQHYTANSLIEKDPSLTNTSVSATHNDEYLSLELGYFLEDADGNKHEVTYEEFTKVAKVYSEDSKGVKTEGFKNTWTALSAEDSENGVNDRFYYKGTAKELQVVAKDKTTDTIFDYVQINPGLKLENADGSKNYIKLTDVNGKEFKALGLPKFEITVKGYAVQVDNITVDEAKAELLSLMKAN